MAIENQPIPASGRVKVMSVDFDDESSTFNIGFTNGKTYEFGVNQVTDRIKHTAMLHGFEQKLRDAAAGVKGNADEAYELVTGVGNRLLAGEWSKTREGGRGTSAYWIEAVMRLKVAAGDSSWGDKATATTRLSGLADDKRDALKKHPQVVAMVAQIKAERAAAELERARAGASTDSGSMEDLFAI